MKKIIILVCWRIEWKWNFVVVANQRYLIRNLDKNVSTLKNKRVFLCRFPLTMAMDKEEFLNIFNCFNSDIYVYFPNFLLYSNVIKVLFVRKFVRVSITFSWTTLLSQLCMDKWVFSLVVINVDTDIFTGIW